MAASLLFVDGNRRDTILATRLLRRLPEFVGAPVRLERSPGLRDRGRAVHAGSFLRERRIAFDCTRAEFPRIFVHEIFHFVWVRTGNPRRRSFEQLLISERPWRSRGELGWSAQWRKRLLTESDVTLRSRRWREYCCESFCDTAAWIFSGIDNHEEFMLPAAQRRRRRAWFCRNLNQAALSI